MGLHYAEDTNSFTPFQREMRHRLWHQLCVLDVRAALDRAAEPVIAWGSYDTPAPLNLNDEDFSPNSVDLPSESIGITESTFAIMTQHHCDLMKRLNLNSSHSSGAAPITNLTDWKYRQQLVEEHRHHMETRFLCYCDDRIPLQWFSKHVHELVLALAMLLAVRPLWPRSKIRAPPPHNSSVLELAINAMRRDDYVNQAMVATGYRWYLWVKWYVLAVALAELCGQPETPYVEMAWEVVERTFERQRDSIADSKNGRLWQPVKKLMKKAQSMRRKPPSSAAGNGRIAHDGTTDQTPVFFDLSEALDMPNPIFSSTAATSATQLPLHNANAPLPGISLEPFDSKTPGQYFDHNTFDPMMTTFDFDSELAGSQLAWNSWDGFLEDFGKMDSVQSVMNFT